MTDNPPDTDQPSRGKGGYLISIPLVLLIMYVAAPLPMVALLEKVSDDDIPSSMDATLEFIFKPLNWLYENVPAYQQWLDWQAQLLGLG